MKRFHVHLSVRDLAASIRFYSELFDAPPSVHEAEYAKWMLEDPRVNFAISTRSGSAGIDHLGIQAENAEELAELGARLDRAGQAVVAEVGTECCHARSDKAWSQDPQGTRWETFHTLGSVATYHGAAGSCGVSSARAMPMAIEPAAMAGNACCTPDTPQGACCPPEPGLAADAPCCGPVVTAAKQLGCKLAGCGDDAR